LKRDAQANGGIYVYTETPQSLPLPLPLSSREIDVADDGACDFIGDSTALSLAIPPLFFVFEMLLSRKSHSALHTCLSMHVGSMFL